MVARRGTSNGNVAGSSYARRERRVWLLNEFGIDGVALCAFGCGTLLVFGEEDEELPSGWAKVTVDRHPIPGCDGGTYRRGNIRPACLSCNMQHGGRLRRSK